MLGSIKATAKETVIYGLGNIAVKIVGLVLIPIYTDKKYFSVEEFGIIGVLDISGLLLISVLSISLPQAFTRWFWDKEYIENQKGIFFMTLVVQLIVCVFFCILLIPISGFFSLILFDTTDWSKVITLLILSSAAQVINNLINIHIRLKSRSVFYIQSNIFKLVVVLSLTLFFILSRGMGIEGIYLAQLSGNIVFILMLSVYTIRNSTVYFNSNTLKGMNSYGFPLYLGGIAAILLNVVDRYSLNSLALLRSVALYTLAIKISSVIKVIFADSVKLAILPIFFRKMNSQDNRRFYSKVLTYSSFVVMFAIVGISLFSLEIVKIISRSKEFWDAVAIVPILVLSIFFTNMKEVTLYGLHIAKKSNIVSYIIISSTALSIILNVLLIPRWDIAGAAVATFLSQLFYWFVTYRYAQKAWFIPYEIKKLFILFAAGALFSFSPLLFSDLGLALRITIKIILVTAFPFVLYLLRFYDPVEIDIIKGFVKKWSDIRMLRKNLMSLKDIKDEE